MHTKDTRKILTRDDVDGRRNGERKWVMGNDGSLNERTANSRECLERVYSRRDGR